LCVNPRALLLERLDHLGERTRHGGLAANIDSLTGIANRSAFLESAGRVVERCRRHNAPVSVMTAALRPNDLFGRLGGEEFAVVLSG
jgi:GGDEF domain-containing protein